MKAGCAAENVPVAALYAVRNSCDIGPNEIGTIGSVAANQLVPSKATSAKYDGSNTSVADPLIVPLAGVIVAVPPPSADWLAMKHDHGGDCDVSVTAMGLAFDRTIKAPSSVLAGA